MAQSITLQTNDSIVENGDVLGRLNFAASNESSGGDALLIGASVYAVGEGEFTSTANPTSLIFSTANSESAESKLKINSLGHFLPVTNNTNNVGSSFFKFANVYATTGNFSDLKISGSIYDSANSTGASGQFLSSTGAGISWVDGFSLPPSGLEGQILYKVTDNSDELAWIDNYATEVRETVKNDTGSGLLKGTVVMATGAVGDRIQVAPAVADGSIEARYMFGVLSEDIDNGQEGYATLVGPLKGISTIGLPLGTVLWIDPDNPGGLTSTQPTSPNLQMSVAIVTNGNANNGRIFVRMWEQQPGLHELHDVNVDVGLASGDLIGYDSSNGTWRNIENPSGNLQSQITQNAGDITAVSGLLGDYVPYSGATQDVDLGANTLISSKVAISGGVVTASTPSLEMAQTWNDGATTFTGILANITDTASASASLLMDLQVGGSSKFKVDKNGNQTNNGSVSVANGSLVFTTQTLSGTTYPIYYGQNHYFSYGAGIGNPIQGGLCRIGTDGITLSSTRRIGWSSFTVDIRGGSDTILLRDSAGVLAQRGNAQTFRLYNTYSSATSYERAKLEWSSGVLNIGTEFGSTGGQASPISIQTSGVDRVRFDVDGDIGIGESLPDAQLHVVNDTASDIAMIVQGAAAQSANLQEWQNSNGDILVSVASNGSFATSGNATIASGVVLSDSIPADTINTLYNNSGVLYFNGSPVNTDTDTTYTAGSGLTLVDTQFNVYGGSGHFVELNVEGPFTATTKSFLINHPLHTGMKLQYGSLEGPENGVYVRGTTNSKVIDLPDYWRELVDETSVTVTLTPLNEFQPLCVKHKDNRHVIVGGVYGEYDYVVYGERKDVPKLKVEWWA